MQKVLRVVEKGKLSKFLETIAMVSDVCVVDLCSESGKLTALTSSTDNTLIAYCELLNVDTNITTTLNLPDVKKLNRIIDSIPSDSIEFNLEGNNIQYNSPSLRFKYHLYEDGLLSAPNISVNKVNSFDGDVTFELTREMLNNIIKGSAFASESNKVYFYTEGGEMKCELTDRSKHNTDALSLTIGSTDLDLKPLPVNLDNIKLINMVSDVIKLKINTEYGIIIADVVDSDINLRYIITSLTQ
tara:strand:- start:2448 stop:3176 length:729 start_codon:yes stop_codon:yes gene_type:complete